MAGESTGNTVRLGIVTVANPLEVGAGQSPMLLDQLHTAFTTAGIKQLETLRPPQPVSDPQSAYQAGRYFYEQRVDAICVLAASWFEDYLVLDMLEECDVPLVLWSRPGMETGSLCGMQQLGYILKQLGKHYCFQFDEVGAQASLQRAWRYAVAAALRHQLRRARIGWLGHRIQGMTEISPNELALKKILGPRVVPIDSQVFLERASKVPVKVVEDAWARLQGQVGQVTATKDAGLDSLQVYVALKEMIQEHGLGAVAAGCYPHLMGRVCLAASLLGEEGVPVSCEGDVNAAVGMLILTRVTGQPVHNTDFLDPIPAENAIVFTHCGSGGFSLAANPSLINLGPVRLMNRGLCCMFPARPGPVTLINIVPTLSGYRIAALYGEATETDMVFPGNPLRVRFTEKYDQILSWVAREGLGHHWMAAYGDSRQIVADWAVMTGCEWLTLGHERAA
jgi:L-fucose isomerase-like protein